MGREWRLTSRNRHVLYEGMDVGREEVCRGLLEVESRTQWKVGIQSWRSVCTRGTGRKRKPEKPGFPESYIAVRIQLLRLSNAFPGNPMSTEVCCSTLVADKPPPLGIQDPLLLQAARNEDPWIITKPLTTVVATISLEFFFNKSPILDPKPLYFLLGLK